MRPWILRAEPKTAKEQASFAIILGCSDSRIPAEIVFDQGLGDLFVIRVAGNVDALVRHAVREKASVSVSHLRHGSEIPEQLIEHGGLLVVDAGYSLETGEGEFFGEF